MYTGRGGGCVEIINKRSTLTASFASLLRGLVQEQHVNDLQIKILENYTEHRQRKFGAK